MDLSAPKTAHSKAISHYPFFDRKFIHTVNDEICRHEGTWEDATFSDDNVLGLTQLEEILDEFEFNVPQSAYYYLNNLGK